ncbi:MAG: hypothetical protein HYW56_02330 [Candidatus Harrisonbacteria bacterium]|nr:hypothetical protein [Candidatus Harrisonbacteria bacterium]
MLLEIYNVAGREEKHTRTTSQKLATAVAARRNATMPRGEALRGVPVCATMKELKNALRAVIATPTQGALIVMMGAGNINEWTDKIISNN